MNRANFGNIITNGMQIGSVGATTLAHIISRGHAEQTLNNKNVEPELTPEQKQYQEEEDFIRKMQHQRRLDDARDYEKGLYSKKQAMTDEQKQIKQAADVNRDMDRAEKRLAGGEDAKQNMTPEQASEYEKYRADKALNEMNKYYKDKDVDDNFSLVEKSLTADSEQNIYIKTKARNDAIDNKNRTSKKSFNKSSENEIYEIIKNNSQKSTPMI